ncbi:MAG: rhodanese-like domain-containing protein, partial [Gemmatimonadetes bacterium]|nr:rhodanese-like domain-containing protein [Gemmatimonadota bacterium]
PPAPAAPAPPVPPGSETLARIDTMFAEYRTAFPGVTVVTVADLLGAEDAPPIVFVDVRPERERHVSRIPGALSRGEFERALEEDSAAWDGHRVVAYCTIGYRSGEYAREMAKRGVDVLNLHGSILAWVHAGRPVVNDDGPTTRVHVYGEPWALLPEGYEAVW